MRCYFIDGEEFSTLEEFASHFSRQVLGGYDWKGNLDALNDILRGGFGTPEEGFQLNWRNSERSRELLGYKETVRQLELRLSTCHQTNRGSVSAQLQEARHGRGATVFDWLVEIIRQHGPTGDESEDKVHLVLQ